MNEHDFSATSSAHGAEVDAMLGLKLLPPIRVSEEIASWLEMHAATKGLIVQAVIRDFITLEYVRSVGESACQSAGRQDPGLALETGEFIPAEKLRSIPAERP